MEGLYSLTYIFLGVMKLAVLANNVLRSIENRISGRIFRGIER